MSVPFPYTINGQGAGIGTIVRSDVPAPGAEYVVIPVTVSLARLPGDNSTSSWNIDERLMDNNNTVLTMVSALNAWASSGNVFLTLYQTDVKSRRLALGPKDFRIHGASCGLAALLAIMKVETDVAVTGYVQSFGTKMSPAVPILPVDCVSQKIQWCIENECMLIFPFSAVHQDRSLETWFRSADVTSYSNMMMSDGFDVFDIGVADSLADLAMVLSAMDPGVPPSLFVPATKRDVRPTQPFSSTYTSRTPNLFNPSVLAGTSGMGPMVTRNPMPRTIAERMLAADDQQIARWETPAVRPRGPPGTITRALSLPPYPGL